MENENENFDFSFKTLKKISRSLMNIFYRKYLRNEYMNNFYIDINDNDKTYLAYIEPDTGEVNENSRYCKYCRRLISKRSLFSHLKSKSHAKNLLETILQMNNYDEYLFKDNYDTFKFNAQDIKYIILPDVDKKKIEKEITIKNLNFIIDIVFSKSDYFKDDYSYKKIMDELKSIYDVTS